MASYSMKHMLTFCTVAEYGGFVGAESVLGMSQPAISTHIRDFEIRLGFQLCHRGRSGFSLTEKGQVVYRKCRDMLNNISDFESELGELRDKLTGTLRLGLIDSTITNHDFPISEAIHRFYGRKNDVSLKLVVLPPEELERELLNGNLHIALGLFHNRHSGLSYQHLCMEAHGFYCGRRHPLFGLANADITLDALRHYPVSSRTYLHHAELQGLMKARDVAMVSNMEAQAILITSGSFLGFLPTHYARQWVERGEMRAIDHLDLSWQSEFSMAMRVSPAPQEFVRIFADDVVATIKAASLGKAGEPT